MKYLIGDNDNAKLNKEYDNTKLYKEHLFESKIKINDTYFPATIANAEVEVNHDSSLYLSVYNKLILSVEIDSQYAAQAIIALQKKLYS